MRLKQVVLPAPLGPIRPTISPSGTLKLTCSTALRPLNRFDTPTTSSNAATLTLRRSIGRPAIEFERFRQRRPHAVGQEHDHEQQADAVENLLHARHIDADGAH